MVDFSWICGKKRECDCIEKKLQECRKELESGKIEYAIKNSDPNKVIKHIKSLHDYHRYQGKRTYSDFDTLYKHREIAQVLQEIIDKYYNGEFV